MAWNTNISEAPKGEMIETEILTQKGLVKKMVHQKQTVWLWTKCGKQTMSYWIPESDTLAGGGRWSGLAEGEQPKAWHSAFKPEPFEVA